MTQDTEEPSAASAGSAMRYASVCDGIGAVHVAWQPLGWQCQWTSEIETFPVAVVEQRWGFPNRGDMTKFNEWSDDGSSIDLLVGGTPCQSFSVAGLRKGLHDPRGVLMLTFLEIAQRYQPRWVVWENVPGVLSSNGGRDFGSFLGALGELGYGWAYRVLDAQWFGVAQRRRRVFVVGCLGDERSAAQVLFESESVRRDNPPSRAKGQGATYDVAPCIGASGRGFERAGETRGQDPVVAQPYRDANCLTQRMRNGINTTCDEGQTPVLAPQAFYSNESRCDGIPVPDLAPPLKVGSNGGGQPPAVAFSAKDHGGDASEEVAPTMRSMGHDGSHANGGGQLAVAIRTAQTSANGHGIANDVAHTLDQVQGQAVVFTKSKRAHRTTDDESWVPGEVSPTMSCFDQGDTRATTVVAYDVHGTLAKKGASETDIHTALRGRTPGQSEASTTTMVAFANRTRDGIKVPEVMKDGVVPALCNPGDGGRSDAVNVVVQRPTAFTTEQTPKFSSDRALTITKQSPSGGGQPQCVMASMSVRRLTPRECERLQGFPDDYTAIEHRKKPAADGPRYKALGNSMAVPVMRWIGERIAKCDKL